MSSTFLTVSSNDYPLADYKRWTVDECKQLERYGFLPEKYELIDGVIINKMGQNQPHAFCVLKMILWLSGVAPAENMLSQASSDAAKSDQKRNLPEPDIALYRAPTYELISQTVPRPAMGDALFIIEVSDTTLSNDLGKKAGLYARANVPEYWVMDVNGRRLIIHLDPVNGIYTSIKAYDEDSLVAPGFASNNTVRVGDFFSPLPKA